MDNGVKPMKVRKRSPQTGSVLVEAAFTLLTLFVFLFGIIEAGRFFQVQQFLTDAAREGARYAVTPASGGTTLPSTTAVTSVVSQFLSAAAVTNATVSVSSSACPWDSTGAAQCTTVNVSAPYQIMTLAMFSNLSITLSGNAMMRNETSP
jgi:Flp pilus assembly protein TadG